MLKILILVGITILLFKDYLGGSKSTLYPDGFTQLEIEMTRNSTLEFQKHITKWERFVKQIKKRVIITQSEMYDEVYTQWRDFVDSVYKLAKDGVGIDMKARILYEKTTNVNEQIISDFTRSAADSSEIYYQRIKHSIPLISKEYRDMLNDWRELQRLCVKFGIDNDVLINQASQQTLEYQNLAKENEGGWSVEKKVIAYLLPALLIGGPSMIALGPLGAALSGVGPASTGIIHLIDSYRRSGRQEKYVDIQNRFHGVGTQLELFSGYVKDNIARISLITDKIDTIQDDIDRMSGEKLRDEFIVMFVNSIHLLNKHSNRLGQINH